MNKTWVIVICPACVVLGPVENEAQGVELLQEYYDNDAKAVAYAASWCDFYVAPLLNDPNLPHQFSADDPNDIWDFMAGLYESF